ncbi:FixH family protein [Bacillus mesophilus]|nr:FixH family protein [Bacillus mesophilus]
MLLVLCTCIFVFFVSACNESENAGNAESVEVPPILEVDLQVDNDHPNVGDAVTISAKVTQGNESVEDASDVSFEVWEQNSDHEMIVGVHQGNGVYVINKKFDKEGIYSIVSHVTARDQHSMPKIELTVGNPSETENENDHEHTGHVHNHHTVGNITIDFNVPDHLIPNKPIVLETSATLDEKPITDSIVKFEIWEKSDTRHEFIEAEEVESGVYQSTFEFKKTGTFTVVIHIQNEELHEHIQRELIVENE